MNQQWKRAAWLFGMLLVALPSAVAAQQGRRDAGPALDATMTELTERLALSESQAPQIRALLETQNERSRAMIEEARGSGEGRGAMAGMRERMREIREYTQAEIRGLLDEKQLAAYEEYLSSRPERGRRGAGPPGRRPGNT
jgi:hypothetical protein